MDQEKDHILKQTVKCNLNPQCFDQREERRRWKQRRKQRRKVIDMGHQFQTLMKLIEAAKLQDCAGRVVCDLNCDFTRYGSSGKKLMDLMTKVQNSGSVPGRQYFLLSHCRSPLGRCIIGQVLVTDARLVTLIVLPNLMT